MEATVIKNYLTSDLLLEEVMAIFFKVNTPESVKVLFWKMFQCWVTRDCKIKADLSDEEIALFFDQLIDLVAAAHILHQANGAVGSKSKEGSDD
jgi:hypothetical protein